MVKHLQKIAACLTLIGTAQSISCNKELSCYDCKENKPPIANAGADQNITLPKDSVLLDGSLSSDPDGGIKSFHWTKISGPLASSIIKPDSSRTLVNALAMGVYKFELTVTDNGGLSAKDTVEVAVTSAANHPPIANAGPDTTIVLPTNRIVLDGSASTDPDNNIITYLWTKISGPTSFNIQNANGARTGVTNLVQGIYEFELKVTDAGGLFSRDTIGITVTSLNTTAHLNYVWIYCSPLITALPNNTVALKAGASDTITHVNITSGFHWTQLAGPSMASIASPDSFSTTITNLIKGKYNFLLAVTYNLATMYDTAEVQVIDDTLSGKEFVLQSSWYVFNDVIPEVEAIAPNRPDLFLYNRNKPMNVSIQLHSSNNWIDVSNTSKGPGSYYYVTTCHFLNIQCTDPNDKIVRGDPLLIRVKFQ
jgi:hypothetical protein